MAAIERGGLSLAANEIGSADWLCGGTGRNESGPSRSSGDGPDVALAMHQNGTSTWPFVV
jgi:hypothetical protein